MSELPGPAGERHCPLAGLKSQNDVTKRLIVARARRVKRYVTVEYGRTGRTRINDFCAGFDLRDIRGGDGAEPTCKASELRALLRHMKLSASREGFRKSRGVRPYYSRVHVRTRGVGGIAGVATADQHQRQQRKCNSVRHSGPPSI